MSAPVELVMIFVLIGFVSIAWIIIYLLNSVVQPKTTTPPTTPPTTPRTTMDTEENFTPVRTIGSVCP